MKFEIYKVLPGMCYNYRSCMYIKHLLYPYDFREKNSLMAIRRRSFLALSHWGN